MSKRKDIEYIHNVKGISYKEARRLYHDNGDDLIKSLGFDYESITKAFEVLLGEGLSEAISHIAEAARLIAECIAETINSIDWGEVLDKINTIEVSDDYFKEGGDNE